METSSQPSLRSELPGLQVPALAVAGKLDEKFTNIARRMTDSSPNMRATVVPEAGHNVHLESPEECERLLRDAVELEGCKYLSWIMLLLYWLLASAWRRSV